VETIGQWPVSSVSTRHPGRPISADTSADIPFGRRLAMYVPEAGRRNETGSKIVRPG
jgi:hypothetical protein